MSTQSIKTDVELTDATDADLMEWATSPSYSSAERARFGAEMRRRGGAPQATITLDITEWQTIIEALRSAPADKGSATENNQDMLVAHIESLIAAR